MKTILKNVAIITLFSVLTRCLGFLFRIYLSRVVGAEALGMYQVALSVFLVLLTLVSSGFTLIISRMTASFRVTSDKKSIASLTTSSLFVGLFVSLFLCIIVLVFQDLFATIFTDENCLCVLIILLPSLVVSALYSVFRGVMWGCDNYFGLCVSEFFEQIVKICVCVLLVGTGLSALQNAVSVAWAFTISNVASAIFVAVLFFVYGGRLGKPTRIYKSVIKHSAPITGVRFLSSFIQPIIAIILPAVLVSIGYSTGQAMEFYGVVVGMVLPILFLPSTLIGSLATALVPDISMAMTKNDNKHIENRVKSSLKFTLFISFLVVPVFASIGDKIGIFLYDNNLSGVLLQNASWLVIPLGITNITSSILNSVGLEVRSFVNYVVGDIFMFLSILFLPKYIGIGALIVGLGVSLGVASILNIFMLKRKLHIKFETLKPLAIFSLISIAVVSCVSFASAFLSFVLPLFFDIVLSTLLSICLFLLFCSIFGLVDLSFVKGKITHIAKKKLIKKAEK